MVADHRLVDALGQALLHDGLGEDVLPEHLAGHLGGGEADRGRDVGLDVPDGLQANDVAGHGRGPSRRRVAPQRGPPSSPADRTKPLWPRRFVLVTPAPSSPRGTPTALRSGHVVAGPPQPRGPDGGHPGGGAGRGGRAGVDGGALVPRPRAQRPPHPRAGRRPAALLRRGGAAGVGAGPAAPRAGPGPDRARRPGAGHRGRDRPAHRAAGAGRGPAAGPPRHQPLPGPGAPRPGGPLLRRGRRPGLARRRRGRRAEPPPSAVARHACDQGQQDQRAFDQRGGAERRSLGRGGRQRSRATRSSRASSTRAEASQL